MNSSIKTIIFAIITTSGLLLAQAPLAQKAALAFQTRYAQAIADLKAIEVKNEASEDMLKFFKNHEFYQVKVYKRLLKNYAQYQSAGNTQESADIDAFVETIKIMRPEILGIMLSKDFYKEFVAPFQENGLSSFGGYVYSKSFISTFSQKTKILAEFLEKYRSYLSASLLIQIQELQNQSGLIKAALEKRYGFEFVQKHSKVQRLKRFFAGIGVALGICFFIAPPIALFLFFLISCVVTPTMLLVAVCTGMILLAIPAIILIPLGLQLTKRSIECLKDYKNVRSSYKDWLEFII